MLVEAGTLRTIGRYPVKSMARDEMGRAAVLEHGIHGDRVYHFADQSRNEGKASWITARRISGLVLYKPQFISVPYNVEVTTPSGHLWNAENPKLAAEISKLYGKDVELRSTPDGTMDQSPISMISMQTVRALSREMGALLGSKIDLDPWRFRANLYVDWHAEGAFFEDTLVGREMVIGTAAFRIVGRDPRCVMIDIDPDNAEKVDLYRLVQREHERHAGVYAEVLRDGVIARQDPVYII
ncbi:MAG: MOSC domain-containing protein [Candidatus Micrarchaeota archaeon]|nr:MOSC domain-containing protein [Candidatus Micrarchaeota archaeon]